MNENSLTEANVLTPSGELIDLNAPKVQVSLIDIALGLANQQMYKHIGMYYSVAQHNIDLSRMVGVKYAQFVLLYGASQALLSVRNNELDLKIFDSFYVDTPPDYSEYFTARDMMLQRIRGGEFTSIGPDLIYGAYLSRWYELSEGVISQ